MSLRHKHRTLKLPNFSDLITERAIGVLKNNHTDAVVFADTGSLSAVEYEFISPLEFAEVKKGDKKEEIARLSGTVVVARLLFLLLGDKLRLHSKQTSPRARLPNDETFYRAWVQRACVMFHIRPNKAGLYVCPRR